MQGVPLPALLILDKETGRKLKAVSIADGAKSTVTNAVKEGAFFGARSPTCDTNLNPSCPDPRNVEYRVSQELDEVAFVDFTARCFDPGTTDFTTAGKALVDCEDGDLYYVKATVPFDLITPIIASSRNVTLLPR